ncbi:MAG: hypothetical protein HWE21_08025 [Cytophagia bacterium]|nr:hypothetical protein [Cytophagia bacterium]
MIRKPNFKLNWKYAMGEVALIFIGISLAIAFQNWNEDRKQNIESKAIIERLLLEVTENKSSIELEFSKLDSTLMHVQALLQLSGPNYEQYAPVLIDSLIFRSLAGPKAAIGNGTLLEGISSGKISLIHSDSLRSLLYGWPKMVEDMQSTEKFADRDNATALFPFLYDEFSFRQMDSSFGPAKDKIGKSNNPYTDNRRVLSMRKFENIMDNKFYVYDALLTEYMGLIDYLSQIEAGLHKEADK